MATYVKPISKFHWSTACEQGRGEFMWLHANPSDPKAWAPVKCPEQAELTWTQHTRPIQHKPRQLRIRVSD